MLLGKNPDNDFLSADMLEGEQAARALILPPATRQAPSLKRSPPPTLLRAQAGEAVRSLNVTSANDKTAAIEGRS